NRRTHRSVKPNVRHQSAPEERGDAPTCAVNELSGQRHVRGAKILPQRSHGAYGDDPFHAKFLKSVDIGAKTDFAGTNDVAAPMAGKKGDLPALKGADSIGVRGFSKGGRDADFASFLQPWHGVETTAADDTNLCIHQTSS